VPARAVLFLFNVIETNVLRESSTSEFSHSLDPKRTVLEQNWGLAQVEKRVVRIRHPSFMIDRTEHSCEML
jgi:hypothetical protein